MNELVLERPKLETKLKSIDSIKLPPLKIIHHHMLLSGYVRNAGVTVDELETWLTDLVYLIGMSVFISAKAKVCNTPGNEGISGGIGLETSHANIHFWDATSEVKFDLYSCQAYNVDDVIQHFQPFDLFYHRTVIIDRNTNRVISERSLGE